MVTKILIPIFIVFIFILLQLVVIPFIAINNVVPNIVLVFLIFYSLKHGQIEGTIFAFFMGFFYDIASGGLVGSGMFSFTIAAFIAGYFHKRSVIEVTHNQKIILLLFMLSSFLFFLFYSIIGKQDITIGDKSSYFLYAVLSAFYTTLFALTVYILPRNKL